MFLGASSLSNFRLGASQVDKIYLGAEEVWSNFQLSDIAGLYNWWDASDASTLYDSNSGSNLVTDQGKVGRWVDKMGNADGTQGTVTRMPMYDAATKSVYFEPASQTSYTYLEISPQASKFMQTHEIFVVGEAADGALGIGIGNTAQAMISGSGNHSTIKLNGVPLSTSASGELWFSNGQNITASKGYPSQTLALFNKITYFGSPSTVQLIVNDSESPVITNTSTTSRNYTQSYIGAARQPAGGYEWPFKGWIKEILFYERNLSVAERASVKQYLKNKWSIPNIS